MDKSFRLQLASYHSLVNQVKIELKQVIVWCHTLAVCSIVTTTLVVGEETRSMAPPIPFTIFPGIIQLARSPY